MQHATKTYSLNQMYFYLTQGCNLACRHCWLAPASDKDGTRYPVLSVTDFESAIREAVPLGLSRVKLTGGEPLLHPRFPDLLRIVRQYGLFLAIETNGMLCTLAIAKEIAKSPDRFVSVSIDGVDADTHDRIRGVAGAFIHAKQAVLNLVAAETPPQIIMTIMRSNCYQIGDMVRMAENLGATSVKFNVVQPIARGAQLSGEALTIEELIALGHNVDLDLAPHSKLQLGFDCPPAFRPLSRIAMNNGCDTCGIQGILGVIPSGHYALCGIGEHIPELVFGRIGDDRLETVWRDNPVLKTIRTAIPGCLEGVCRRCLMKWQCQGACIAQNYYRTRNLLAPFWFCEAAEQMGLFPKTRLMS